ncbi:MAG TPA: YajG family lipoprotein [Thiopseudomonas sp.]|nr:YajG family lipoprotein [Thiopseudomonas sp.]
MSRYLMVGAAVLLAGVLTGCGLSPQHLQPEPRFTGQVAKVGQGQPVTVLVRDARSSPIIGTRGGLYANSSVISVSGASFLPRLQAETDAAVRMMGFTPMSQGVGNAQLTLTLTELSYKAIEKNPLSKEAKLQAVYTLEAVNGTRRYSGRYAATLTQGYASAPNEQKNNEWVSSVLGEALQRVFNDPAVGQLFAY